MARGSAGVTAIYNLNVNEGAATKTLIVSADASGQRLDHWLATQLPEISRVRVRQLIEQKKVQIHPGHAKASLR